MLIELRSNGEVERRELALISHRGGKGFGPENTLQSLEGALDFGVEMVETDVRMSGDGVPVIHHSPFLGLHLLARMTVAEIGERAPEIPTLREYLDLAGGRCAMNLEIKRCDASVLAAIIAAAEPVFPILVSSFDADFLEDFRRIGSPVELGLLSQYELAGERILKDAHRCGANTLLPVSFAVRNGLVDMAHTAGLRVITWTVNSPELLQDTVAAGVDGVITDSYPEIKEFLESGDMGLRADKPPLPDGGGCRPKGGTKDNG
jgi:glycerophosphoryl diester phosphodiesterase